MAGYHGKHMLKKKFTAHPKQKKVFPNKKDDYRTKQQLITSFFAYGNVSGPGH